MYDLLCSRRKQEMHWIQPQPVAKTLIKQHMNLVQVAHTIHVVSTRVGTCQDVRGCMEVRGYIEPDAVLYLQRQSFCFRIPGVFGDIRVTELGDGSIGRAGVFRKKAAPLEQL